MKGSCEMLQSFSQPGTNSCKKCLQLICEDVAFTAANISEKQAPGAIAEPLYLTISLRLTCNGSAIDLSIDTMYIFRDELCTRLEHSIEKDALRRTSSFPYSQANF